MRVRSDGRPLHSITDARIHVLMCGPMRVQEGVKVLQPRIRTFSELPGWLAANRQELAHKRILMYCTGGVRCERASAYVRSLGNAFQDVHQLEGALSAVQNIMTCCAYLGVLPFVSMPHDQTAVVHRTPAGSC